MNRDSPVPREPPLTDEPMSWPRLLLNLLMIPAGLLLLVPLAILVALWFYLVACKEGIRLLLRAMLRRRDEEPPVRRTSSTALQ